MDCYFILTLPFVHFPKVDIQAITHTDGVEISEYQGGPRVRRLPSMIVRGTKRCKPEEVYPKADYAIIFTGGKGWTPEQYQEELVKFAPHVKFCLEKPDYLGMFCANCKYYLS